MWKLIAAADQAGACSRHLTSAITSPPPPSCRCSSAAASTGIQLGEDKEKVIESVQNYYGEVRRAQR